jgi:hypothetical protein
LTSISATDLREEKRSQEKRSQDLPQMYRRVTAKVGKKLREDFCQKQNRN